MRLSQCQVSCDEQRWERSKGSGEERKLKEERREVQGERSDRNEKLRSHLIFKLPGDG